MDGSTILSGPYNVVPSTFYFGIHDYYGGTQETVIDDFEVKLNGSLVYQQNFESTTMPDGWSISGLNPGTYINSGDPSTPHSGSGSLAIGATTGGDLGASIAFDLSSIPEPSSIILGIAALGGMALSRNRPKSS